METQPNLPSPTLASAAEAAAFAVSDNAFRRITKLLSDEPAGSYFRVSVLGGGCSGFQYQFDLDASPIAEGELVIQNGPAKVVIDDVSLGLLGGSQLDFVEDLGSAGFEIKNPNAKSGCGCGNSFSIG